MPLKIVICSDGEELGLIKSFLELVTPIKPKVFAKTNELMNQLNDEKDDFFIFLSAEKLMDPACADFFPYYKRENLKVFLYFNWDNLEDSIRELLKKRKTIFGQALAGVIDFSRPHEIFAPSIRDLLNSATVAGNFGEMVDNYQLLIDNMVQKELKGLRDLKLAHHSYVKLRSEKNKFFTMTSRYLAGLASGGDFFDTISTERGGVVILSSTSSYVVSGMVLAKFEEIKRKKKNNFEEIMQDFLLLSKDIRNTMNDEKMMPKFLFMEVDHAQLQLRYACFGDFLVVSSLGLVDTGNEMLFGVNPIEESYKNHQLNGGERIMLASPGLLFVSNGKVQGQPIISYLREELKRDGSNCINELFFSLKENVSGEYVSHDSSAIVIEVKKNVVREV